MRQNLTILLGIAAFIFGSSVEAQTSRDQRWEGTLQLIGTGAESSDGESGSSLDVDSAVGLGFGFAYNINEHFAIGFDGSWVQPSYTAVFDTEEDGLVSLRHEMTVFNGQIHAVWNMLSGPFTPFVQGGLGWTFIDSNVTDGPPVTGCWWDPWWGYICSDFYSTYSATSFSWDVGAGLRYELQNDLFLKASYNHIELDAGTNGADPSFDMWRLEVGWMF